MGYLIIYLLAAIGMIAFPLEKGQRVTGLFVVACFIVGDCFGAKYGIILFFSVIAILFPIALHMLSKDGIKREKEKTEKGQEDNKIQDSNDKGFSKVFSILILVFCFLVILAPIYLALKA